MQHQKLLLVFAVACLLAVFVESGRSMVVELDVRGDRSAQLKIWLPANARTVMRQKLVKMKTAIERAFPGKVKADTLFRDARIMNPALLLSVKDLKILQDSLNCIDFYSSQSFFKRKYYLKLLLNPKLLQSSFFVRLEQEGIDLHFLSELTANDPDMTLMIRMPGKSYRSDVEHTEGYHVVYTSIPNLQRQGRAVTLQSAAFIPSAYVSVFILLLLMVGLGIKFVLR